MKKVLAILLLTISASAMAQHHGRHHGHGHWHRGYNGGWNWVVPAVIGGAVVYSATRPDPVIIQQPVIVQNPPVMVQQETCSAWKEIQSSDGTIYRERTCTK